MMLVTLNATNSSAAIVFSYIAVAMVACYWRRNNMFGDAFIVLPNNNPTSTSSGRRRRSRRRRMMCNDGGTGVMAVIHSSFSSSSALNEHTLNLDEDGMNNGDFKEEEDGPKAQLLNEISTGKSTDTDDDDAAADDENNNKSNPPTFGFTTSNKSQINQLVQDLSGYVLPLDNRRSSSWQLLYSSAPDIFGVGGGPFSQLVSITQNFIPSGINTAKNKNNELNLVLEYQPSKNIVQLFGTLMEDIQKDRLQQTVAFDYTVGTMNTIQCQLRSTTIDGTRLASSSLPALSLPTSLPFGGGSFTIIFNDGDIRIDRTVQGDFIFIYKKI